MESDKIVFSPPSPYLKFRIFTLVCALLLSLNCSTLPETHFRTPFDPRVSFTVVVSGEGFLCGLRPSFPSPNVSVMHCWRFFNDGATMELKRIYNGSALTQLEAGNSHICGLNETNALECWQWPEFNQTWEYRNFSSISVGEGFMCGFSKEGKISCHGDSMVYLVKSLDGIIALPQELERRSFITIKAKRNVFSGVSTLDYSLLFWGDSRFNSSSLVFSEVRPGPCRSTCPCDMMSGTGSFCSDGGSICKACLPISPSLPSAPSPPQPQNRSTNNNLNGRMVAFLVVGCVGSFSLLLVVGFFVFRYCKGRRYRIHDSGRLDETSVSAYGFSNKPQAPQASSEPAVLEKRLSQLTSVGYTICSADFSLDNLILATNNFSEDHKIGVGSFGSVYRATCDDGLEVAIKRAEVTRTSSYVIGTKHREDKDDAFINELEYLSRLHHKNLVRLLGFCEDANERVLSSNILLNASLVAEVSDFGLSLSGPEDDESHLSLEAAGTVGYMDPEYYRLQRLTTKSDVYSFGVVLLELLSGYKAIHMNKNGSPRNVVDFVVPYIVRDEIHRVLDRQVPEPTMFEIGGVASVGYLAAACVGPEGRQRPSMFEVVKSLKQALTLCLRPPALSRTSTESST
ncbi:Leucine-rich receptor-like protein kinase family protein isoform 1 [Hibiscus syriacus]|uniref:Leucine-rich receptor-like protein kinase family protein isoform 1 n=1 Tax=Hibiscus syriacus TaxID=106335 RepID=A0A6A3CH76_HIBSY|nr:Leucine-rich receptor-like protein kinase family protein isoform 1 [Hibiscus syriacus]